MYIEREGMRVRRGRREREREREREGESDYVGTTITAVTYPTRVVPWCGFLLQSVYVPRKSGANTC